MNLVWGKEKGCLLIAASYSILHRRNKTVIYLILTYIIYNMFMSFFFFLTTFISSCPTVLNRKNTTFLGSGLTPSFQLCCDKFFGRGGPLGIFLSIMLLLISLPDDRETTHHRRPLCIQKLLAYPSVQWRGLTRHTTLKCKTHGCKTLSFLAIIKNATWQVGSHIKQLLVSFKFITFPAY